MEILVNFYYMIALAFIILVFTNGPSLSLLQKASIVLAIALVVLWMDHPDWVKDAILVVREIWRNLLQ